MTRPFESSSIFSRTSFRSFSRVSEIVFFRFLAALFRSSISDFDWSRLWRVVDLRLHLPDRLRHPELRRELGVVDARGGIRDDVEALLEGVLAHDEARPVATGRHARPEGTPLRFRLLALLQLRLRRLRLSRSRGLEVQVPAGAPHTRLPPQVLEAPEERPSLVEALDLQFRFFRYLLLRK
jgi:hypothetical protein